MKTLKRKLLFLLVLFISFSGNSFSQINTNPSSFYLSGELSDSRRAELTQLISVANFETFRLRNEEVSLVFEEGFSLNLLPGDQMASLGLNPENYPEEFPEHYQLPTFSITPSGIIHAKVHKVTTKE